MNPIIEQLKSELNQRAQLCGDTSDFSILEFLWYHYSAGNPVDEGQIARADQALLPIHQELSFENSDKLCACINDLCYAYQRAAFLDGLEIGIRLMQELRV